MWSTAWEETVGQVQPGDDQRTARLHLAYTPICSTVLDSHRTAVWPRSEGGTE